MAHPAALQVIATGCNLAGEAGEVTGGQGFSVGGEVVVVVSRAVVAEEGQQLPEHHVLHYDVEGLCGKHA